ncbi:hypothetical protein V1514DRAFT_19725 [Lipomyces japonicus]|uniref:uncharacterized protein n=1 Tax=Lipomyces japonicus TaxID=56871 RepID=UPI0034CF22F3
MTSKYLLPKALKEVRFHLSQTGEASAPLRSFLKSAYPVIKKHNPYTPVLIREAAGIAPQVTARFEFGKEVSLSLEGVADLENSLQKFLLTPP